MHTPLRRLLTVSALATIAALGLAACGDDGSVAPSTDAPTVTDAWARSSAALQSTGAAYMEIKGGKTDDKLTGASVSAEVAAKVEVHETAMATAATDSSSMAGMGNSGATGMMEMRAVASIAIRAGKTVSLAPGGYHMMMLELTKPLVAGQKFTMTLTFDKSGQVDVPVTVRAS